MVGPSEATRASEPEAERSAGTHRLAAGGRTDHRWAQGQETFDSKRSEAAALMLLVAENSTE